MPVSRTLTSLLMIGLLASPACNLGRTVDRATLKSLAPGMLANGDVAMVCAAGEALAPTLMAIGHRSGGAKEPKKAAALTLIAAGMCSEKAAWEAELERHRLKYMVDQGDVRQALAMGDLLIRERRAHAEAASRDLLAYERVVAAYGAPTEDIDCPRRLPERDQLLYLLGMTAGLLAVIHDSASERAVGVSQAIPRHVERGVTCVDDGRWWGLPSSLRAAIAASVPGAGEAGVDPWAELERAAGVGEAAGVWLGRALQVHTAAAAGKEDVVTAAIVAHGRALRGDAADPEVALLNAYASGLIQHHSDLLWIKASGQRTRIGRLGELPEPPPLGGADPDSFLEGLEDEAASPATEAAPAAEPTPATEGYPPTAAPPAVGAGQAPQH